MRVNSLVAPFNFKTSNRFYCHALSTPGEAGRKRNWRSEGTCITLVQKGAAAPRNQINGTKFVGTPAFAMSFSVVPPKELISLQETLR